MTSKFSKMEIIQRKKIFGKNLSKYIFLSGIGRFWHTFYESKEYKKIVPVDSFIRVKRGNHTVF